MRFVIASYVILCAGAIGVSTLRPFGAPELQVLRYWAPLAALVASAILLAHNLKVPRRTLLLIGIPFVLSAMIAVRKSERNDLFLAEAGGSVSHRYVGGHGLCSVEVRDKENNCFYVEGIPDAVWASIQPGQNVQKRRESFDVVVEGELVPLDHWSKVWKGSN